MKQKVLSILALLLMAVTGAWADTTVTWTESDMSKLQVTLDGYVADNNTIKGITVTASGGGEGEWFENDINNYSESSTTITFTSSVGNIKSIAIKANDIEIFSNPPGGWTLSNDFQKLSWSGDASSTVSLLLSAGEGFRDISEIVFTIEPDPTYIVAGNNAEIFGIPWDGTYEANKMTKGGDGKYTKTYNVEDAFSDIELKVVKDGEDWIGDETGFNVTFSMKQAGSFTVTLDPNANPVYVTVTGDNVVFANTEYAINYATGMQNGTVTGPDTAKEDDEVTLTITPAAGYVLESISVTGVTTENAVEVTDGKFTMPAEDVNVIATFKLVTYAIFAIDTDGTTQDFGSVEAGATAQKTFTITNSGNKSLYVTISNPEDFTAEMTQNANLYFADALGWGDIHVYYWPNGPEWPGAAMTELYTNELGQKVYCYELPADVEGVIFNGNGNETGDIKEPIGKAYYNKDDKTVGTWSYDNCVPAGMSRVLTVTMNTATLGSKSGNITLSFDAKNAMSFTIPCTGEVAAPTTYIVAGNYSEIFGIPWYGTYEANKMTKGGDGKYTKTYNVEDAFSDIQLKVVKDGQDWIGDETGNNVTFSMIQAGSFTVTLDPNANPVYVTVTGDNVVFADTEYAINYATGMQNGTVTGPDTAKEDDEVTLTITPAAGYVLESISVTGVTTENAVEVTDGKFTMPAEDVNVIATFKSVTYAITLAEGTEDAGNWTISPNPAEAGQTVTISYTGTKKVKSIKAVKKAAPAPAVPDGAINGKFSVSDTKQVYFSKGNLRYASGAWSFFDNQYDYYTSHSADAWDKFGWSTSATTYGMNTSEDYNDYSGNFVDWGAMMGTGWFTLSSAEWTYLFNTRSASTVGDTENGRYAKAKVNNVQGVIFFPDTYTHPDGVTAPTGVNATGNTGWNGNNYSSADWTKMESAGCVFLPAAGYRYGSSVDNAGALGYYWSATPNGTDYAYCVAFGSGNQNPAYDDQRGYGFSVRLVREVTE